MMKNNKIFLIKPTLGLIFHLFVLSFALDMVLYKGNYWRDFRIPSSLYLIDVPVLTLSVIIFLAGWAILGFTKKYE